MLPTALGVGELCCQANLRRSQPSRATVMVVLESIEIFFNG
ncbi:hypothetical protein ACL6C3_20095 [Capilliphycus salinus ALCB114379]